MKLLYFQPTTFSLSYSYFVIHFYIPKKKKMTFTLSRQVYKRWKIEFLFFFFSLLYSVEKKEPGGGGGGKGVWWWWKKGEEKGVLNLHPFLLFVCLSPLTCLYLIYFILFEIFKAFALSFVLLVNTKKKFFLSENKWIKQFKTKRKKNFYVFLFL